MKCSPCPDCETLGDSSSTHRMIIEVLNLLVSLIMDKTESQASNESRSVSTSKNAKSPIQVTSRPRKALEAIERVLDAVSAVAATVLRHLGETVCSEKHVGLLMITSWYF